MAESLLVAFLRTVYDGVGLSNSRAALLHLFLIGLPHRWGLLLTGWGFQDSSDRQHERPWIIQTLLSTFSPPPPCSIFAVANSNGSRRRRSTSDHDECSETELFALRDLGVRFLILYHLMSLLWCIIILRGRRRRKLGKKPDMFLRGNPLSFHKILAASSGSVSLLLAYVQNYYHPSPNTPVFEASYYRYMQQTHIAATMLSLWTLLMLFFQTPTSVNTVPADPRTSICKKPSPPMKWSIPANSIFWGGVVNAFAAIALVQYLYQGTLDGYFLDDTMSDRTRLLLVWGALYTAMHAALLFRLRIFLLDIQQLRTICLYKVFVQIGLFCVWLPERQDQVQHHEYWHVRTIPLIIRGGLMFNYFMGFICAGKAEGVSSLLTSEKDE